MRATTRPVDELYAWLLGRPDQLGPIYERLRAVGIEEPSTADGAVENITGTPSSAREWSYRERRKELLVALLDQHADDLDTAVDELGRFVDHLRQTGIRGFVAEHTGDRDFVLESGGAAGDASPDGTEDEAPAVGTPRPGRSRKDAGSKAR